MAGGDEAWTDQCLESLESLGIGSLVGTDCHGHWEGREIDISVGEGEKAWSFRTLFVRQLRAGTAAHQVKSLMLARSEQGETEPWLLFTERVTESLSKILRDMDISYVDMAGNAWIAQSGLFIWIEGRKAVRSQNARPKIATPTALQLEFLLLKDKGMSERPYRDLALRSDLALGTVSGIMSALTAAGYIQGKRKVRSLRAARELHAHWEQRWHERLRPKLNGVVCKGRPDPGFETLLRDCADEPQWLVGGELAATGVVGDVEPTTATLHVPRGAVHKSMEHLKLLRSPEGNIRILETFGLENGWDRRASAQPPGARLADPMLIRAELLEGRDERLHSLADELLTTFIAPRWEP